MLLQTIDINGDLGEGLAMLGLANSAKIGIASAASAAARWMTPTR